MGKRTGKKNVATGEKRGSLGGLIPPDFGSQPIEVWRVTVTNVRTGYQLLYTCDPRRAVIAAYAQTEHGDYETWNYPERYGHLVSEDDTNVSCGDWTANKAGDSHETRLPRRQQHSQNRQPGRNENDERDGASDE